jgi:hypothetical protein
LCVDELVDLGEAKIHRRERSGGMYQRRDVGLAGEVRPGDGDVEEGHAGADGLERDKHWQELTGRGAAED